MTTEELMTELSSKIYERPLSKMWDNGSISNTNDTLSVFALANGFETERAMNGIFNCFGNSTGIYLRETIEAFEMIGAQKHAEILKKMITEADKVNMNHESIQEDRSQEKLFEVTNWAELHGAKWETAQRRIDELEKEFDSEGIYEYLEKHVEKHFDELLRRLKKGK